MLYPLPLQRIYERLINSNLEYQRGRRTHSARTREAKQPESQDRNILIELLPYTQKVHVTTYSGSTTRSRLNQSTEEQNYRRVTSHSKKKRQEAEGNTMERKEEIRTRRHNELRGPGHKLLCHNTNCYVVNATDGHNTSPWRNTVQEHNRMARQRQPIAQLKSKARTNHASRYNAIAFKRVNQDSQQRRRSNREKQRRRQLVQLSAQQRTQQSSPRQVAAKRTINSDPSNETTTHLIQTTHQ